MSTLVEGFPSIRGFRQKTGELPMLVNMQILAGRLTVQRLFELVKEDKELFLRFLAWFTGVMKNDTDPVALNKAKQFMVSVRQKYRQDEKVVRQVNQHAKQLQTALSRYEKTRQQIWTRHADIRQLLTRRVVNPTTSSQQQVGTYLKTPKTDLVLFVLPDNTLVMAPNHNELVVRCDGRTYQQYMDPRQGQAGADSFYQYTGANGHRIHVDAMDMSTQNKKMQQQNKYIFPNSPKIVFLSDNTKTVEPTIPFRTLSKTKNRRSAAPECPQDSSIIVHQIKKIVHIPRDFIP